MKIPVFIEFSTEVMADVSLEDITAAIAEDVNSTKNILTCLNNIAKFLKAIPEVEIQKLSVGQIEIIQDFMQCQADIYKRFLDNRKQF